LRADSQADIGVSPTVLKVVQNVWVGIDTARGPEEYNWYIQIGRAW